MAGIRIPAGTLVMLLMRPAATDERHFPDAQAFDPARWLADGAPGRAASSAKRVAMPFGAGPRICPGRYLAMLEIKMVIAMLLGGFDIERVSTPDGGEPRRASVVHHGAHWTSHAAAAAEPRKEYPIGCL